MRLLQPVNIPVPAEEKGEEQENISRATSVLRAQTTVCREKTNDYSGLMAVSPARRSFRAGKQPLSPAKQAFPLGHMVVFARGNTRLARGNTRAGRKSLPSLLRRAKKR